MKQKLISVCFMILGITLWGYIGVHCFFVGSDLWASTMIHQKLKVDNIDSVENFNNHYEKKQNVQYTYDSPGYTKSELFGENCKFIMISDYPEVPEHDTDFCLSEFFVLYKYRRSGCGKEAVNKVLDLHHGKWQLKRHPHNIASVYFWDKVINDYTKGNYKVVKAYQNPEVDYDDGTPADVFFFEN